MALKMAPEFKDIAEKIVNKFSVAFAHLDLDQILFLKDDSRAPKKYADIMAIKQPYTFVTNYKFIMTVYEPTIISFTDAQLNLLVYHELLHIDENFEKLVKHDIQDFKIIVGDSRFGCDWDMNPNIPDILV